MLGDRPLAAFWTRSAIGFVLAWKMSSRLISVIVAASLFAGTTFAAAGTTVGSTSVSGHEISVRLPGRWTGVVYQRAGGLPILHAASFRLPPVDGDDGAQRAVRRMRSRDVLIVMLEYPLRVSHYPRRALPLRLRRSDFSNPVEGMPLTRAFARMKFSTAGRSFDLWVEFGSKHARPAAITAVDRVLATLRIRVR
jgi:hypothetical protein